MEDGHDPKICRQAEPPASREPGAEPPTTPRAALGSWQFAVGRQLFRWSAGATRLIGEGLGPESELEAFLRRVHAEDRPVLRAALDAGAGGGPMDTVVRVAREDGAFRRLRLAADPLSDDGAVLLCGFVEPAPETEAHSREQTDLADRLLRTASRAARLGGWSVRLADRKVFWTEAIAEIHGLPPGSTPDYEGGIDHFAPEDRVGAHEVFEACAVHGMPFNDVRRILTPAGERVWVRSIGEAERDASGRIVAVHGAMQDISELMATRQEAEQLSTRLLNTFESIRDAFLTLDREWRLVLMNQEAARQLQCDRAQMLGNSIWAVFPEAEGSSFQENCSRAMETGATVRFLDYYAPLQKWFDFSAFPSDEGLSIYFQDVTGQREQERQLRLLEAAVSRQNDILLITDASTPEAAVQARIVYVNDAFTRLTGFTREEAIGQTPRILQGPRTQREQLDRIRAALGAGDPVRAEVINYTRDGREYWLDVDITPLKNVSGKLTHFVAVQRDVTSRKQAEAETRMLNERFRLAAQATRDVVWDWDIPADRIWWSDAMQSVYGHDDGTRQVSLDTWLSQIHPDDRDRVRAENARVLYEGGTHWEAEYRFLRASGDVAAVMDRGFVIRDAEGRPVRMVGSMTDMTERRVLEEKLRRSQRLQAVGQLTGGVAHDFNNLLTVILGNAELLADRLDDMPALRELAEMTADAAERGADLTGRLLAFARRQSLEPEALDVNALVRGMEGLLRRTLSAEITLEYRLSERLPSALVDRGQLESALLNLVLNSRDAMESGGLLTVGTSLEELDEDYARRQDEVRPGRYVAVAISDTGCGMTRQVMEHAFDPFFTTKELSKGSGLGLSMVYGFVKQSGGHATIESVPGAGTTVRLYLPAADAGGTEASPTEREGRKITGGTGHILVVEDDPLVLDYIVSQLSVLGYRVSEATDGPKAQRILEERDDIDLLFTDIVMPGGLNGIELAHRARKLHPAIRVLFTSGYAETLTPLDLAGIPDARLLSKPYRRAELSAWVREAMGDAT